MELEAAFLNSYKTHRLDLHSAVKSGRKEVVEYMCNNRASAEPLLGIKDNSTDSEGFTILHKAAQQGELDMVQFLCKTPATKALLFEKTKENLTPLHVAKNREVAETLVNSISAAGDATSFLLARDEWGNTCLHCSVLNNNSDIVEYLLDLPQGHQLINTKTCMGDTPLHFAKSGCIARQLLEVADHDLVVVINEMGWTALHRAVGNRKMEVVRVLCTHPKTQCLITMRTTKQLHFSKIYGGNPLITPLSKTSSSPMFPPVAEGTGNTALHIACSYDDADTSILELLCEKIRFSDHMLVKDQDGCTALHYATTFQVAKILVDSVESPSQKDFIFHRDNEGQTALHLVADPLLLEYFLNLDIWKDEVNVAKDRVAFIKMQDTNGNSAILYYCKEGRSQLAMFVLQFLADNDQSDLDSFLIQTNHLGENVFHLVFSTTESSGYQDFILDIVDLSDDIPLLLLNMLKQDSRGNTPLLYLLAKYETMFVAQLAMRVPLERRKRLFDLKNKKGLSCRMVSTEQKFSMKFYLTKVLDEPDQAFSGALMLPDEDFYKIYNDATMFTLFPIDFDILTWKVVKYALNEYLITTRELTSRERFETFDEFNVDLMSPKQQASIQNRLYYMDSEKNEGYPKVSHFQY